MTSILNFGSKKDKHFKGKVKETFGDLMEEAQFGCANNWLKTLDGCQAFYHIN